MNRINTILVYLMTIAFVLFSVWLFWVFVTNFNAADPSIKAGLIGLIGTFLIGIVAHYQTKKRKIQARHFADKRNGYMHMIDLIFDFIISIKKMKNWKIAKC